MRVGETSDLDEVGNGGSIYMCVYKCCKQASNVWSRDQFKGENKMSDLCSRTSQTTIGSTAESLQVIPLQMCVIGQFTKTNKSIFDSVDMKVKKSKRIK